jgi:DNA-binding NarL/FixJ family response regulator
MDKDPSGIVCYQGDSPLSEPAAERSAPSHPAETEIPTALRDQDRAAEITIRRLTPHELDVLAALAQGLSDGEIAEHLHVSYQTVRTHMVRVLGKLGAPFRLQALVLAVRSGLVRID